MFGIGMSELLVILVVALIIFGPTRLPELARSLGRAMAEFRRASTDLRSTFEEAARDPKPAPPSEPAAAAPRLPSVSAAPPAAAAPTAAPAVAAAKSADPFQIDG
jgi:sec-independent protein translocase protein TatB